MTVNRKGKTKVVGVRNLNLGMEEKRRGKVSTEEMMNKVNNGRDTNENRKKKGVGG